MRLLLSCCAIGLLCGAFADRGRTAGPAGSPPMLVGPGRSIQFAVARGQVWALWSASVAGAGQDLMFAHFDAAARRLGTPARVNDMPGEVRDTNENSPLLLAAHDESALYAIWVGANPEHTLANRLRFARFDLAARRWSPPIVINDDPVRATHSFHGAAVNTRGEIDVAWLDRRHNDRGGPGDYPGGGDQREYREVEAALYTSRSIDGGRTFGPNRRIATSVCACCRAAVAHVHGHTVVAWRSVTADNVRDIVTSRSIDGVHWSTPAPVWRDGWVIEACPHAGPAMIASGDRLYIAWMTGQSGTPVIAVARSDDGGRTFTSRRVVSEGMTMAGGPVLLALRDRLALAFHGSGDGQPPAIRYRTMAWHGKAEGGRKGDAELSPLDTLSPAGQSATHPSLIVHEDRRITGWVERTNGQSRLFVTVSPMPRTP